jgi:hypothetical protein
VASSVAGDLAGTRTLPGRLLRSPVAWIVAAYVVTRLVMFVLTPVATAPDTVSYEHTPSLLDIDFWAGFRPWATPLLYKLVPEGTAQAFVQSAISTASWVALALVTARALRTPRLKPFAAGLVLVFGLSGWIVAWDTLLLSESLALSGLVAGLAAWMAFAMRPTGRRAAVALVITFVWAFARNVDAALVAIAVVPLLVAVVVGPRRRLMATTAAVMVGIVALSIAAGSRSPAVQYGLLDQVGRHVLTDGEMQRYFAERGMPTTPDILRLRGQDIGIAGANTRAPHNLIAWVKRDGRATYASWVLSHPGYVLKGVYRSTPEALGPPLAVRRFNPGAVTPVPRFVEEVFRPPNRPRFLAWALALLGFAVVVALLRGVDRRWIVPAFGVAASGPFLIATWLPDDGPIYRYGMLVAELLCVSLLLLAIVALDRLLAQRAVAAVRSASSTT